MRLSPLIFAATATAVTATKPHLRTVEVEPESKSSAHQDHSSASSSSSVSSPRTLQSSCLPSATYLGCYANKNSDRALPLEAFGPKSRGHTAQECQAGCLSRGYTVFAREFKGQCFCGNGSDYAKHGVAMGCDCCGDNVGASRFCAWEAGASAPGCDGSGSDHSAYLGCYANRKNDRALPVQVPGKGHTVMECEQACEAMGMSRFAREWKGQCFCGNESHDYTKHGRETGCDCCGDNVGGNKMCVYVNGNMNR
mmetsp:Transcript_11628/g.23760  ORF Transcript_11628/g.23760 Transcript_11628/m.23760 type:complete len:253 (-) Transcript_11628:270-1028(-)|eukprot:CAMPEP_0171335840 /NCGR_PEP_ID=MMETSP0878-20121228/5598_1 /TAXON_ID=67004 /ORGANISM="Thalassiosira weissflogii, Strain CCMP1336" /LENGTH=252 /DNA_ID=CAMNT_0011837163 /DNA_START=73 /DNA_END=831 /DNA_ORIENTATION=+